MIRRGVLHSSSSAINPLCLRRAMMGGRHLPVQQQHDHRYFTSSASFGRSTNIYSKCHFRSPFLLLAGGALGMGIGGSITFSKKQGLLSSEGERRSTCNVAHCSELSSMNAPTGDEKIVGNGRSSATSVRIVSPAARRHLIRVYRLLLGGLSCALGGFVLGLATFAAKMGVNGALSVKGGFVVPSLTVLLKRIGLSGAAAMAAGSGSAGGLSGFLSLVASTSVALPLWAPFAAVFLGMVGLAITSYANDTGKNGSTGPSPRHRLAGIITLRRFIFYTMSFAEGAALVPLAKALLLTNFTVAALLMGIAVVAGYASVAVYRGGYHQAVVRNDGGAISDLYGGGSDDTKANENDGGVCSNTKETEIEQRRIITAKKQQPCADTALPSSIPQSSLIIEGLLYGNVIGLSAYYALLAVSAPAGLIAAISPPAMAIVAAAVSAAVASDTSSLLSHYAAEHSNNGDDGSSSLSSSSPSASSLPPHISSFFILDEDREDFDVEMVGGLLGYAIGAAGLFVRLFDVCTEVAWDQQKPHNLDAAVLGFVTL